MMKILSLFVSVFLLALATPAQAQTYGETLEASFTFADGAQPNGGLVRDAHGNFYGTAFIGGGGSQPGTVFKVDSSGNLTVVYTFTGENGDGANPMTGLIIDQQGNLYGTTAGGGDLSCVTPEGSPGCGTIFKIDSTGKETVLYAFPAVYVNGIEPRSGLVQDAAGNLYGLTVWGGNIANCGGYGCGTLFKLDTARNYKVIYEFQGGLQGYNPLGTLALDPQGNLYGTLVLTGDSHLDGTVYRVDASGNETTIYTFVGENEGTGDGSGPNPGLVFDGQGNLYGTTLYGGSGVCTCGTVFKLTPAGPGTWTESVLYSFTAEATGEAPNGGLTVDTQNNVYGTTISGGSDLACSLNGFLGCGTVFEVDTAGKQSVLFSFSTDPNQLYVDVNGGLFVDSSGDLYGTTSSNGTGGYGSFFELKPLLATSTTLTSSTTSSTYGQAVMFTAAVTSSAGAPPNGETVTFETSAAVLGTGVLSNGSASFTTSVLKVGTDSITAVYFGDQNLAGSTSKVVKVKVAKAATTTTLTSSLNPSLVNQSVTFTAIVTPEVGVGTGGSMTFYDGATVLGVVQFNYSAQFSISTLSAGTHNISAVYGGSDYFIGSTSNTVSQVVATSNATTTTLTSKPNPSLLGQAVTLTATVTNSTGGTPTGTVTFMNGATTLATKPLSGGVAQYKTSSLPLGYNTITAVYGGDSNDSGSTSPPLSQLVREATTTTLVSSLNPSSYGLAVTLTVTVNSKLGPPPDGETISFKVSGVALPTCALKGGSCSLSTAIFPGGTDSIIAEYDGDSDFKFSQSKPLKQIVDQAATTTSLISSQNPSNVNQAVTFTASVTAQSGGTVAGSMIFYDGAKELKSVALSGGTAAYTTSKLAAGTHSITAKYAGNGNFATSTSPVLTQTVN
jgi:uncharacterized repeat protein (TIGR03803 family)